VLTVKGLGGSSVSLQYNTAIPHLIGNYLPEGMLGIAITGLLAAFMAGVAANVTAFNTVVTYDLIQAYFVKDRDPAYYLRAGRLVTVVGIVISVFTAFIAKGYSNIMKLHPDPVLDLQRAAPGHPAQDRERASRSGLGAHARRRARRARGRACKLWWRSPILLGGVAMVLVVILNIVFA
jgi:hypothetical protein